MNITIADTTFRSTMPLEDTRAWYLCTPYSKYEAGREQAYLDAAKMTMYLQENSIHLYCPIVHSHTPNKFVSNTKLNNNHDFWLTIDKKFVKHSRGLIVCKMQGWNESKGISIEIDYAKELGLPILYTNFMEIPKELT